MGRKKRGTHHNGRVKKGGIPFSDVHDDRNFDIMKASNIDPTRTHLNQYWSVESKKWYKDSEKDKMPTFSDVEQRFYTDHFTAMYEASRERSRKRGQLKRVKPFEEWRKSRQFVPEETYLQVGSVEDGTVDIKTFVACIKDYLNALNEWNNAHNKPFTVLNAAFHFDEEGRIPQFHLRRVWHSVNPETGIDEIGQAKALERAGVALPDDTKPCGTENNRKMTFDREMREKWLDICEKHGIDIERVPASGRKHNQTKEQWITDRQKAREKDIKKREKALEKREKEVNQTFSDTYFATAELRREKAKLEGEIDDIEEYRAWKAQKAAKAALEAEEAARKEREAQEARERQKAAQKPQKAAEAVPQPVREPTPEPAPEQATQEQPKGSGFLAALLSRTEAAAKNRDAGAKGPDFPGL